MLQRSKSCHVMAIQNLCTREQAKVSLRVRRMFTNLPNHWPSMRYAQQHLLATNERVYHVLAWQ